MTIHLPSIFRKQSVTRIQEPSSSSFPPFILALIRLRQRLKAKSLPVVMVKSRDSYQIGPSIELNISSHFLRYSVAPSYCNGGVTPNTGTSVV